MRGCFGYVCVFDIGLRGLVLFCLEMVMESRC